MINAILQGRLGNHLFIYAACRRLALKHNAQLRFFISPEDYQQGTVQQHLSAFNIAPVIVSTRFHAEKHVKDSPFIKEVLKKAYKEKYWAFNPAVLHLPDNLMMYGYFQSEKYFKDVEHIIREELSFKERFVSDTWQAYRHKIKQSNSVSVHVRRGDYIGLKTHEVCTKKYFSDAIRYLRDNTESPEFFIFSDDVDWCRQQTEFSGCQFVAVEGADTDATLDLELMSLCKHNIGSNSSYSWWGAWLNTNPDKIVVVPERWFNAGNVDREAMRDTVIADWIRLPV